MQQRAQRWRHAEQRPFLSTLCLWAAAGALVGLGLVGCGGQENVREPRTVEHDSPVKAFALEAPDSDGLVAVHDSQVVLRRSALGKDFLLSPTVLSGGPAPSVSFAGAKKVQFSLHNGTLALLDSGPQLIYTDFKAPRLLQTFDVIAESPETITFRWDVGVRRVPLERPYQTSDLLPSATSPQPEVVYSYLQSIAVRGDALELHQVFLTDSQGELEHLSVILRLQPAGGDRDFVPLLSTRQEGVGFFEVAHPRQGDGTVDYYAMRWNLSQQAGPLTYAIAGDVPQKWVAAIREGILYWNQVLGRDVLHVQENVSLTEMPQPRRVLVRWLSYKHAPGALAHMQANPDTGEMLNAEVYITDSWVNGAQNELYQSEQGGAPAMEGWVPRGFEPAPFCALGSQSLAGAVKLLQGMGVPQERIDRGVADLLRSVVAHEVGHTLGLRHNFAASLATELESSEALSQAWQAYLDNDASPGAITASSVMDYAHHLDAYLLGAAMGHQPLSYDQKAMAWAYGAQGGLITTPAKPWDFCTDAEAWGAPTVVGCQPHDSGRNPFAGVHNDLQARRSGLAKTLILQLLEALEPESPGDVRAPDVALRRLQPDAMAVRMTEGMRQAFTWLGDGAEVLEIKKNLWLDPGAYEAATVKKLAAWLDAVGGLPGLLFDGYGVADSREPLLGWLVHDVELRTTDVALAATTRPSGSPFHLRPHTVAMVRAHGPQLAARLEQAFLRELIAALTGQPSTALPRGSMLAVPRKLRRNLVKEAWQAPLGDLARELITASAAPLLGHVGESELAVTSPRYHRDLRQQAVRLLSPVVFGRSDWLQQERRGLVQDMRARLAPVVRVAGNPYQSLEGAGPSLVLRDDLSPDLAAWGQEELAVLDALESHSL